MQRAESPSLAIRMLRRCCIRRSISKQRRMTAHSDGKSEARKLDAFSRKTRLELSDIRYLPRYNGFPLSCGMVFIFRRIERVSGGWILEIDDLILWLMNDWFYCNSNLTLWWKKLWLLFRVIDLLMMHIRTVIFRNFWIIKEKLLLFILFNDKINK